MDSQPQVTHTESVEGNLERTLSVNDYIHSRLISLAIGAQWGHCYEAAYPAFFAFPQFFEPHGQFVEGWIVFEDQGKVVHMEHGWLVNGARTIDPTVVLIVGPGQPVYYFPGVFRARTELLGLENELFPYVRFSTYGDDGMGHDGYRIAYETSLRKAHSLLVEGKTLVEVKATVLEMSDGLSTSDYPEGGELYGAKRG